MQMQNAELSLASAAAESIKGSKLSTVMQIFDNTTTIPARRQHNANINPQDVYINEPLLQWTHFTSASGLG